MPCRTIGEQQRVCLLLAGETHAVAANPPIHSCAQNIRDRDDKVARNADVAQRAQRDGELLAVAAEGQVAGRRAVRVQIGQPLACQVAPPQKCFNQPVAPAPQRTFSAGRVGGCRPPLAA